MFGNEILEYEEGMINFKYERSYMKYQYMLPYLTFECIKSDEYLTEAIENWFNLTTVLVTVDFDLICCPVTFSNSFSLTFPYYMGSSIYPLSFVKYWNIIDICYQTYKYLVNVSFINIDL